MLDMRQMNNLWYKFDYLFSWEDNVVTVFINDKENTTQPFHMGSDPFASGQGQIATFTGADSLVLYTLSPGGKSEFADVKLCEKQNCKGAEFLQNMSALYGISSST